jgi:hypothetical protein
MQIGTPKEMSPSTKIRRRWLPIAGATIVLATFVVKDAWRESLKDLIDSIDSAQNVFLIRDDSKAVTFQLRVIEQKIDGIDQRTALTTKDPFTTIGINSQLMITRELLDNIDGDLDKVSRLAEKVPSQEGHKKILEELQKQLRDTRVWFRQTGVIMARNIPSVTPDGVFPVGVRQEIADAFTKLSTQTNDLWTKTHDLSGAVLTDAASNLSLEEGRFKKVKIASYALYSIGWVLTLCGKIFGIEDLASAE